MGKDRWLSIVLRIALLGLFIWMVHGLLVPVALGALFALILTPFDRRIEARLGKAARFSSLILTTCVLVVVVIPFILISIQTFSSINDFITRDWTHVVDQVQGFLSEKLESYGRILRVDGGSLRATFQRLVEQVGTSLAGLAGAFATALPALVLKLFLFVLALYYFLRDERAISQWMYKMSPFPASETENLFRSIVGTVNGAVLGLLATAAVQGGLTTAALYLFGVPGAFFFGILATLLSVVPLIGTTPVTVGATIYLIASGRFAAAIGMGIAMVVIGLSDNIVRPWVQSSRAQMHPLLALLAIFGGIQLFGAAGIFVGPVVAAMAFWAIRSYTQMRQTRAQEQEPPPA